MKIHIKQIYTCFLISVITIMSQAQSDIVPSSNMPSSVLDRGRNLAFRSYSTLDEHCEVKWKDNLVSLDCNYRKDSGSIVCSDSSNSELWKYNFQCYGKFRTGRIQLLASSTSNYMFLVDQAEISKKGKKEKLLLKIHRLDNKGSVLQKNVSLDEFNASLKSEIDFKDFKGIEDIIVINNNLFVTATLDVGGNNSAVLIKFDLGLNISTKEIKSEYEISTYPQSDKSEIRLASIRGDTLYLIHSTINVGENLSLLLYQFDSEKLVLLDRIERDIDISSIGTLVRTFSSKRHNMPIYNLRSDQSIFVGNWMRNPDQSMNLLHETTFFSLNGKFVIGDLEDGLLLYGFYGDNRNDITEKGIWYAKLPFRQSPNELSISLLQFSNQDLKSSGNYETKGTLDLYTNSDGEWGFSFFKMKKGTNGMIVWQPVFLGFDSK